MGKRKKEERDFDIVWGDGTTSREIGRKRKQTIKSATQKRAEQGLRGSSLVVNCCKLVNWGKH